jgi:hypothetical protein
MKATKIFLAIIFIMAISFGVKAQDKYEYATVSYIGISSKKGYIGTSFGNKYEEKEVIPPSGSSVNYNLTPVLEEVNKMNLQGWEVYANNILGETNPRFIYYLRKKKS